MLLVKEQGGKGRMLAFQAKLGKRENTNSVANEYDVKYKIGTDKNKYQIDEYNKWLSKMKQNKQSLMKDFGVKNLDIEGYYLFYNGEYSNYKNKIANIPFNKESYYAVAIEDVMKIATSKNGSRKYSRIALEDILNQSGSVQQEFSKLL